MRTTTAISILLLGIAAARPAASQRAISPALEAIVDSSGATAASWAVVRGGIVVEMGAWGTEDGRQAVDPDTTVFRVASLSKVMTAAVAAVAAARGDVDLDADLRERLPWLSARLRGDAPVTLRQLLTHTSGLDDRLTGMFARSAAGSFHSRPTCRTSSRHGRRSQVGSCATRTRESPWPG